MRFNFKIINAGAVSAGQAVLLRLDLNLPIVGGKVQDDFRLRQSLPTVKLLKAAGARVVILSHTDSKETDSLLLVAEHLKKFINLVFAPSLKELPERLAALRPGGVLFVENLRRDPGEMRNDPVFAKTLASFGDIYVNDAFAVSHRQHVSIVGLPRFLPSYAGLLFTEEVARLSKAFNPPRPFVFILAGDKFETKMPLVKKFLKIADGVFIGGALANDLFKAKGYEIGLSKHTDADLGFAEILGSLKLILPSDLMTESKSGRALKKPDEVLSDDSIFDAGPETIDILAEKFSTAKFILWNGTLGVYEKGFTEGTKALAGAIAESGAESIVGGGDTLAVVGSLDLAKKFSFVSTGGGAMLQFLANGTLPGIVALQQGIMNRES